MKNYFSRTTSQSYWLTLLSQQEAQLLQRWFWSHKSMNLQNIQRRRILVKNSWKLLLNLFPLMNHFSFFWCEELFWERRKVSMTMLYKFKQSCSVKFLILFGCFEEEKYWRNLRQSKFLVNKMKHLRLNYLISLKHSNEKVCQELDVVGHKILTKRIKLWRDLSVEKGWKVLIDPT